MPPVDPNQIPGPAPEVNPAPTPVSVPPPTVPMTASMPAAAASAARSGSKMVIALVCALVLFIAAGSAGAYYFYVIAPSTPTGILQKALLASMGPTSFSFVATSTGKVVTNIMGDSAPAVAVDFTLTMQGSLDNRAGADPAFDGTFGGTLSANNATSTGQARFAFHTIYTNKKVYLNLSDFNASYKSTDPKEAGAQFFVIIANGVAASLENKWIETDASSTSSGVSLSLLASSSPALTRDKAALTDYARGMSYLESVQNAGVETVGGTQTNHLVVTMRFEQKLADLILALESDQIQNSPVGDSAEYAKMKDALSAEVGKEAHVDLWVGTGDSRIYKITMAPIEIHDKTSNSDLSIGFEITYADYGKDVSIVAPAGAQPLEQVMQSLFGGLMPVPSSKKAK